MGANRWGGLVTFATRVRTCIEWLFGRWYEGPSIPYVLHAQTRVWANSHLYASRADWVAFCESSMRVAYEAGWQRGYEHVERDPLRTMPSPELLMPSGEWRNTPINDVDLCDPERVPVEFDYHAEQSSVRLSLVGAQRRDGLPL